MNEAMTVTLKTLTPLWTGGADGTSDRLHATGIIGSLRWWYEAVVRGLGGYACDPTTDDRCPSEDEKHCTACELFGCTGWARKFRLHIVDENGQLVEGSPGPNETFKLRFVELRPISNEEKWLLAKTVEIAAQHGALGGKTTLKPQKKGKVGADYGIVEWVKGPVIQKPDIAAYLHSSKWRLVETRLPDLRWFFFIRGGFLWRNQMNPLLGLNENGHPLQKIDDWQRFLQGRRGSTNEPAVSKKIFSFRADGGRIWGYAKDKTMRDQIIKQVRTQLGDGEYQIKTGEEVLHEL